MENGEIGLNQIIEFTDKLEQQWPDIDRGKVQDFISGIKPRELNELWWMYKEAFYTSIHKKADVAMQGKLRAILVKYHLLQTNVQNNN